MSESPKFEELTLRCAALERVVNMLLSRMPDNEKIAFANEMSKLNKRLSPPDLSTWVARIMA